MAAWKGALELAGVRTHVRVSALVKGSRDPNFKTLAHDSLPPVSKKYDHEGNEIDETFKGVEVEKGVYRILTEQQLDQIKNAGKTEVAEPVKLVPVKDLDLAVNVMSYSVVPDHEVAGAEDKYEELWLTLKGSELAYVTQLVMRGGGKDAVLAIYATDDGLAAIQIPFAEHRYQVPELDVHDDPAKAKALGAAVKKVFADLIGPLDSDEFKYDWLDRRETVIAAALAGEEPELPEPSVPESKTSSLMAALEDAARDGKPKKKASAKAGKKVAA